MAIGNDKYCNRSQDIITNGWLLNVKKATLGPPFRFSINDLVAITVQQVAQSAEQAAFFLPLGSTIRKNT